MTHKAALIVLTPTPAEHEGVAERLSPASFRNFTCEVVRTGPGKVNAASRLADEIASRRALDLPLVAVVCGTSGSLSLELKSGEVVCSLEALISDWTHEDGVETLVGPYGEFDYGEPDPQRVERMLIKEERPALKEFMERLGAGGFSRGRILTSDAFVSGKSRRLSLGKTFGAAVCDMESGAFALTAKARGAGFFILRVVADTLDETLDDYFQKELNLTSILGEKALEALGILDSVLDGRPY